MSWFCCCCLGFGGGFLNVFGLFFWFVVFFFVCVCDFSASSLRDCAIL